MAERFQGFTYAEGMEMLGGKEERKIGNNTKLVRNTLHDTLHVFLHGHGIVTLYSDGRIRLDSCGWRTVTTRNRMNGFVPVRQDKGNWYVAGRTPFHDGITINIDGTVRVQA